VRVVYTQQAVQDLVDAYEYLIGRNEIWAAQRVDAAVARVVERLAAREFEDRS
jgi:plasmid stabilization system protein ParE